LATHARRGHPHRHAAGKLARSDFEALAREVDPYIEEKGGLEWHHAHSYFMA
jgi:hypothetical protein